MNGNDNDSTSSIKFKYTVTLGNIITMLIVVVSLISSWIHITDGMNTLQAEQAQTNAVDAKLVDELNTLERNSAQQSAFIRDLRDRLSLDEAYQENVRKGR